MTRFLQVFFTLVLLSMLAVTSWASFRCPLFSVPKDVATHPWFIATLFDAYWGFLTFFVWVCFKQTSLVARGAWLVAILLLGNLAMAAYCLAELWRLGPDDATAAVLTRRREGVSPLGLTLAAIGVGIVGFAARA